LTVAALAGIAAVAATQLASSQTLPTVSVAGSSRLTGAFTWDNGSSVSPIVIEARVIR